jgi:uncharacterized phage protein gp47/JayE
MITIPTTNELYEDILADLEAEFGDSIPLFGKIFLRALAGVQAAKLKLYYLAIANLQKNIFIDTADPEASGGTLERFGRIKLGRNPFPATAGQYEIQVTGTVGAVINSQTTFKSDDDSTNPGKLFILDSTFTLATNPDTLNVRALEAGLDSQLNGGDTLTATIPIALVNKQAVVVSEVVEPLSAEDIEDYRNKGIDAYRSEPQGGAAADYRLWALDAQGVRNTYPYTAPGDLNEVNLYVEATVADSTDGKGTPSQAILDAVQEVVEFDPDTTKPISERGRQPLAVDVNYLPVSVIEIDITIDSFNGTSSDEALVITALIDLINSIRPFIAAADVLANRNDVLDTNRIISTILSVKPGAIFGSITLIVGGISVTTHTFLDGNIPFADEIVFS